MYLPSKDRPSYCCEIEEFLLFQFPYVIDRYSEPADIRLLTLQYNKYYVRVRILLCDVKLDNLSAAVLETTGYVFLGDNRFVRKIEVAMIDLSICPEEHLHAFFVC